MTWVTLITTLTGLIATCVGVAVGVQSYRKTKLEADKLKRASTTAEAPPASTPNEQLVTTLAIISRQLEMQKSEVDTARVEVSTLRTDLQSCLSREAGRATPETA